MRRVALLLEYNGARFAGSQLQPGRDTVQGELEKAIEGFLGAPARAALAGRTDAGVHARGQVAAFSLNAGYAPDVIRRAINARLERDIAVRAVAGVAEGFDPRRDARSRWYRYTMLAGTDRAPLREPFAWVVPGALDAGAMRAAGALLTGTHDFRAFAGKPEGEEPNTVRRIDRVEVTVDGGEVQLDIEGSAFLPHQVRIIAGALVRAGRGELEPSAFAVLLERGEPGTAAPAAPAQGLCLMGVRYEGLEWC